MQANRRATIRAPHYAAEACLAAPRERRCSRSSPLTEPVNLLEAILEVVQYEKRRTVDQNKDGEEKRALRSRQWKRQRNGKCSTHSDIKLILFIMHRSNGALLARAYIMQKQVLAFSVCFVSIFIQITLVHGLRREPFLAGWSTISKLFLKETYSSLKLATSCQPQIRFVTQQHRIIMVH